MSRDGPDGPAGQSNREVSRLGAKVRALRRRENLSQVRMAERLGISPSYLNLIESNRRPLPAVLLIKLAQMFQVDLHAFGVDDDARTVSDLLEAFSDPLFEPYGLTSADLRDLALNHPQLARAAIALYSSYKAQRAAGEALASRLDGETTEEGANVERSLLPSEEVSDLIQNHMNYFPELEEGSEELWKKAKLEAEELYPGLVRYLDKQHGVHVRIARGGAERGVLRRFDTEKGILTLSELLPTRARTFQLAHQVALLTQRPRIDRIVADARLTTDESRALARVALANYFAGAVIMPYAPFLEACEKERYDVDVVGRRFRVGFEQVCHRYTTLRKPGAEGVPFHMIRIDVAGNISKRFSASGIRFARFSGACPRWNVFAAFMTPGMIRIQLSRFPDNSTYFCIARTIHKDSSGYHATQPVQSIGLGCLVEHARQLVYSDGIDLDGAPTATPVGVTCRLCERSDCDQRAFPSIRHPLQVDENVRGVSLYAPAPLRVLQ
ncbi:MAG TPA: short-chain fatty acyl-CoA regulator family protein [Polyangiaceae bacterium]|nr:short-chain fatty acyl-CoA regulator family protein [Polyangiaceae bacterium]